MKILSIAPYPLAGPSSRYRMYIFKEPLADRGIELDIRPFLSPETFRLRMHGHNRHPLVMARVAAGLLERAVQLALARQRYDLIFVQRQPVPVLHELFNRLVVRAGLPVVFDMDDAVFTQYPIGSLLRGSAAVTVGNDYLRAYVQGVAPGVPVTVIPTTVDTDVYVPVPGVAGKVVVGWIGTSSTFARYLWPFLPGLVRVCDERGAEFRVIASPEVQGRVEAAGAVFVPWSLDSEVRNLQAFDVGVMPLLDDEFVRGKCAFKLIEYGAVGRPSVGSDIGANREVIRDGVTGSLAHDAAEFEQQLDELLTRPELRASMGAAARAVVVERFSLHSQVDVLAGVLRAAAGRT